MFRNIQFPDVKSVEVRGKDMDFVIEWVFETEDYSEFIIEEQGTFLED